MQKLFIESFLPVGPEDAWEVFESDAFRTRLQEQTGLASTVRETRMEGDVEVRTLTFTGSNDLPKLVAKALGSNRLSYDQTNRFDKPANRLDWVVEIPKLGDRVSVKGETWIEPHEDGSRRVVRGEIAVNIRLIGGQIEKVVAGEFRKSMERAVDLAREMMDA